MALKADLSERECANVLRALADETRLRILESLLVREKCVGDLVEQIGKQQPHMSHHLRILREAGLIEGIREGQRVCYRIAPGLQLRLKTSVTRPLTWGAAGSAFRWTSWRRACGRARTLAWGAEMSHPSPKIGRVYPQGGM
ncbi:MAG: metalloregulator ArsR/SmtB family transcription factor [Pseudomonadota bacterium]|nr:metalloregulator ArsR/SmtB family transcription factor [Pseudomonadota bacterium]